MYRCVRPGIGKRWSRFNFEGEMLVLWDNLNRKEPPNLVKAVYSHFPDHNQSTGFTTRTLQNIIACSFSREAC